MLIFEQSSKGRCAAAQLPKCTDDHDLNIPKELLRTDELKLPEVSEMQVVRHYTRLSQKNYSIDTHFYPLGSCTMKYNPRAAHAFSSLAPFLNRHPYTLEKDSQGFLKILFELQEYLKEITGMKGVSLTPMAGAQGEFAGVAMIRAYHQSNNDLARTEFLIPDAAHGTNPASAVMCAYKVKELPTSDNGDIDLEVLSQMVGPQTAGIMLTNPSTLGVFERNIQSVSEIIHKAGGLLYYDGANLNAILGRVRPGDMGFDVMHMNLHKTFATPHGGGGPGAGPIGVSQRLVPFLPVPNVIEKEGMYSWEENGEKPNSIGRLSAFMGNAGILLRAYIYIRMLGAEGLHRVAEYACLNANYMMQRLKDVGFTLAYPERRASHEFIVSLSKEAKAYDITATDVAKRLLDYGVHAPTIYFPLLVPECMLIEPTETETKEEIDAFVDAMEKIMHEIKTDAELVRSAPHTCPVTRLDEIKAAKDLDVCFEN